MWNKQRHFQLCRLRKDAILSQGGLCFYCHRPMVEPTAEHLRARMDGGKNDEANVVAACRICNQRRHSHFGGMHHETYATLVLMAVQASLWSGPKHFQPLGIEMFDYLPASVGGAGATTVRSGHVQPLPSRKAPRPH